MINSEEAGITGVLVSPTTWEGCPGTHGTQAQCCSYQLLKLWVMAPGAQGPQARTVDSAGAAGLTLGESRGLAGTRCPADSN